MEVVDQLPRASDLENRLREWSKTNGKDFTHHFQQEVLSQGLLI